MLLFVVELGRLKRVQQNRTFVVGLLVACFANLSVLPILDCYIGLLYVYSCVSIVLHLQAFCKRQTGYTCAIAYATKSRNHGKSCAPQCRWIYKRACGGVLCLESVALTVQHRQDPPHSHHYRILHGCACEVQAALSRASRGDKYCILASA